MHKSAYFQDNASFTGVQPEEICQIEKISAQDKMSLNRKNTTLKKVCATKRKRVLCLHFVLLYCFGKTLISKVLFIHLKKLMYSRNMPPSPIHQASVYLLKYKKATTSFWCKVQPAAVKNIRKYKKYKNQNIKYKYENIKI